MTEQLYPTLQGDNGAQAYSMQGGDGAHAPKKPLVQTIQATLQGDLYKKNFMLDKEKTLREKVVHNKKI